jgi:hypothetical protein
VPYLFHLPRLVLDRFASAQEQQPGIIVKLIETPHDPTGISDAIVGALGLTGALTLAALIFGIIFGGLMFLVRSRHPLS